VGDEHTSVIVTCRERRHEIQGFNKRQAILQKKLAGKKRYSRRYKRIKAAKNRSNAKHKRVMRDIQHKISRAIVDVAEELSAGTIVMGDIRHLADGINIGKSNNQKISQMGHGVMRRYVEYKAQAKGIKVELQEESYTSQTCCECGSRNKVSGRVYRCQACGATLHRDVNGQINILSKWKHGEAGKIKAPTIIKHRIPHNLRAMRRWADTPHLAIGVAHGLNS
jgi:putative transposase